MLIQDISDGEGLKECLECSLGKLALPSESVGVPNPAWKNTNTPAYPTTIIAGFQALGS